MSDLLVPAARGPVRGAFRVPPSKSVHQRAILLSALAEGESRLLGTEGAGEDVASLAAALESLGRWTGSSLGASRERRVVDLGLGATGFRFVVAAATLRPQGARTLVRGRRTLLARPHRPLLLALGRLGGHVKRRHSGAVRVLGGGIRGGPVALPPDASSQYASALLLIAPRIGGLALRLAEGQVSRPYVALTLSLLRAFGADVSEERDIRVAAGGLRGVDFRVPPDASAAAAWWAVAALTGGETWVEGLTVASPQADARLLAVLGTMGATVRDEGGAAHVLGRHELAAPGEVDLRDAPDLLPLVAVLAARAEGVTRIVGVAHARGKESDRIARVARGLQSLGAAVEEHEDGLTIRGGRPSGGVVDVRGDHRLAFAFGVLGLVVPGLILRGAEAAVGKSHPAFLRDLRIAAGGGPAGG